jgi:EmrB/QacA subfamily drug resistance transporter
MEVHVSNESTTSGHAGSGPGSGETPFRWTRRHAAALTVLCLAALLDTVDTTVVNVAMPAIRHSLHFSEGSLAWMVTAYMVPFGGFLLLAGRTGDLLGRRRVLLAGTAVFALASLASGLARNATLMIATRAAEGLAAAFVVPMTLALLSSVFPPGPARNRAFGVWGGVSAVAGTLGLILGGLMVSTVGWRWVFFINIPVGAVVLASALRVLPGDNPRGTGRRGFDIAGAVTATGGASLLAYAVVQTSSHGWGDGRTIGLLAAAAAVLGYFLIHEAYVAATPLLPLSLWRNRSVSGANVVAALQSSAVFAMFYCTTLYMQQVQHYSALRTGLAYIPLGLSILVAAGTGPVLVPRLGERFACVIGSLISMAGLIMFARIPASGHLLTDIIVPEVIVGIGVGMVFIPSSIAAMAGVPAARAGVASALLNVSRQLGGALGLAVISSFVVASTARAHGPAAVALTAGFRTGFAISAGLTAATALAALILLRDDSRGQRVDLVELQAAGA